MALTMKTMKELYEIAMGLGIKNVKKYRKVDLITLITSMSGSTYQTEEPIVEDVRGVTEDSTVTATSLNNSSTLITMASNSTLIDRFVQGIKNVFRFDHNRATVGDVFTKRMGESKIRLNVVESDKKSTTLTTNKGIRLKVIK